MIIPEGHGKSILKSGFRLYTAVLDKAFQACLVGQKCSRIPARSRTIEMDQLEQYFQIPDRGTPGQPFHERADVWRYTDLPACKYFVESDLVHSPQPPLSHDHRCCNGGNKFPVSNP